MWVTFTEDILNGKFAVDAVQWVLLEFKKKQSNM